MKYDFSTIIDRRGMDALAVDGIGSGIGNAPDAPDAGFDAIPMWIADMNFATLPDICEAMKARIDHPLFGYFPTPKAYYDAIINWQTKRNGVQGLMAKHIGYENGVLGGVASALSVLCSRGDKVLVHAPTYVGFTSTLENNGYEIIHSYLKQDASGVWRMDYDDMEAQIEKHHIHAAIFCSPHNPTGRVWERDEIAKAMEIYRKHDVYVVSDEIWSDLVLDGHKHVPTQSVSEDARERTVALYAPSKTFNLAGLIGSYHIIYNDWLRERVDKAASLSHYNDMNVLSMHALIGAYSANGEAWLSELLDVLGENVRYGCDFIKTHFEGVSVFHPEGTYMLFVDCEDWCKAHGKTMDELEKMCWKVGVSVQDGRAFHGPWHLRMNLALPKAKVVEAFERLREHVF